MTVIDKGRARDLVAIAKAKGQLVAEPCEVCGELRSEAHHDDYARPLDVRWLCLRHHREWHRAHRQEPKREVKSKCVKVRLEPSLLAKLIGLAEREQRSVGGILRLALHHYLESLEDAA